MLLFERVDKVPAQAVLFVSGLAILEGVCEKPIGADALIMCLTIRVAPVLTLVVTKSIAARTPSSGCASQHRRKRVAL